MMSPDDKFDTAMFVGIVRMMREKQIAYFKDRRREDLMECKTLERKVDELLKQYEQHPVEPAAEPVEEKQLSLFGEEVESSE